MDRQPKYWPAFREPVAPIAPDPTRAVCKVEKIPTSVFFVSNERDFPWLVEGAKQFCRRCPEREVCLEYALAMRMQDGIYGERTSEERRRMLNKSDRILANQAGWDVELRTVDWNEVARDIGLPKDWRRQSYDPPEYMIDCDSEYLRDANEFLGCLRNKCSARFTSLEACFRHTHTHPHVAIKLEK